MKRIQMFMCEKSQTNASLEYTSFHRNFLLNSLKNRLNSKTITVNLKVDYCLIIMIIIYIVKKVLSPALFGLTSPSRS